MRRGASREPMGKPASGKPLACPAPLSAAAPRIARAAEARGCPASGSAAERAAGAEVGAWAGRADGRGRRLLGSGLRSLQPASCRERAAAGTAVSAPRLERSRAAGACGGGDSGRSGERPLPGCPPRERGPEGQAPELSTPGVQPLVTPPSVTTLDAPRNPPEVLP